MLKIKDNVDLKELEKYGFKAKYDEDTGIIKYFYKEKLEYGRHKKLFFKNNGIIKKKYITIRKENYRNEETSYENIYQYEIDDNLYIQDSAIWQKIYYDFDTLYDLIKADLVEKVSDDNE